MNASAEADERIGNLQMTQDSEWEAGLPVPRRLIAFCSIALGQAVCLIDGSVASIALPTIAADLGVTNSASVLIVTVYQLVLVMTILPLSALGDKVGHNRMYSAGLVVYIAATGFYIFADNLIVVLIIRSLQAVAAAEVLSVSSAIVKAIYPADQLGKALVLNMIVGASAATLAPTLGGLIISHAPWPLVFVIGVPLGLIASMLAGSLPVSEPKGGAYDLMGALLCAATFGLLISSAEYATHGGALGIAAAATSLGAVVGFFFVRRERGLSRPIMPVDLLVRPALSWPTVAGLTAYMSMMIIVVLLPFQLQQNYGFSPAKIGALMASTAVASFFIALMAATLSDRVKPEYLAILGAAPSVIDALTLAALPANPATLDILWRLVLFGIGMSFLTVPTTRMFIGAAPRDRAAAASGLIARTRLMGQTLGATIAAALLISAGWSNVLPYLVVAALFAIAGCASAARLSGERFRDPRWR